MCVVVVVWCVCLCAGGGEGSLAMHAASERLACLASFKLLILWLTLQTTNQPANEPFKQSTQQKMRE